MIKNKIEVKFIVINLISKKKKKKSLKKNKNYHFNLKIKGRNILDKFL